MYDLGELLYGFLVRFGEEFDMSRVRLGTRGVGAAIQISWCGCSLCSGCSCCMQ